MNNNTVAWNRATPQEQALGFHPRKTASFAPQPLAARQRQLSFPRPTECEALRAGRLLVLRHREERTWPDAVGMQITTLRPGPFSEAYIQERDALEDELIDVKEQRAALAAAGTHVSCLPCASRTHDEALDALAEERRRLNIEVLRLDKYADPVARYQAKHPTHPAATAMIVSACAQSVEEYACELIALAKEAEDSLDQPGAPMVSQKGVDGIGAEWKAHEERRAIELAKLQDLKNQRANLESKRPEKKTVAALEELNRQVSETVRAVKWLNYLLARQQADKMCARAWWLQDLANAEYREIAPSSSAPLVIHPRAVAEAELKGERESNSR